MHTIINVQYVFCSSSGSLLDSSAVAVAADRQDFCLAASAVSADLHDAHLSTDDAVMKASCVLVCMCVPACVCVCVCVIEYKFMTSYFWGSSS